ncbi:MAG: hypothetical protein ACLPVY_17505 [Acidimicrobiia bacterium]
MLRLGGGMRVIGRLLVTLAVTLPISFAVASGVAHGVAQTGSGPAVIKCMHWKDGMTISPGIENSPADQNVAAHGKLYGCNKAGGGAQFSASFQMSQATCSNLAMSGVAQFDWADGETSTAFLTVNPQANEPRKQYVTGSITSGGFQGLIVSAWVRFTEVFNGSGINCSTGNPLQQLVFSNTQSYQLLAPTLASTTTVPTGTTTPNTSPATVPQTTAPTTVATNTTPTSPVPIAVIVPGAHPGTLVIEKFPTGTLAFTGSSGVAALVALEAILIGGALVLMDPQRKIRRASRMHRRPKSFLSVTLPK